MGSIFSHSSVRAERTKTRWRKGKRKSHHPMDRSTETDEFDLQINKTDKSASIGNLTNTYDDWTNRNDVHYLSNVNVDPPGAPSTYPPNYLSTSKDIMNQSRSSSHEANNLSYQMNSHSLPVSSATYDPHQHLYSQVPSKFLSQPPPPPQMILEERPSKKVQFAPTHHQPAILEQQLSPTQSWHETNTATNNNSAPIARREQSPSRPSTHRSTGPLSDTPPSIAQKAVYVGIDHQATLAGRGQITAERRSHKITSKSNGEESNSNNKTQRIRPNTHHHHHHRKNQELSDSSTTKANIPAVKSLETLQPKLSGSNRPLTTTSTSTIRQTQHGESRSLIDNEVKPSKTTNNHQHRQHRQQQQQQQQRSVAVRHESPVVRRVESKPQIAAPVIRTPPQPLTRQQKEKRTVSFASPAITGNITRTRI